MSKDKRRLIAKGGDIPQTSLRGEEKFDVHSSA